MRRIIFYNILLLFGLFCNAQNVKDGINKSRSLMNEEKYDEAYNILRAIGDKQVEDSGDSIVATYNYYKGSCLYYLKKYEEAIPTLQKATQVMDKIQKKDCDYLEMLYGIGACYKEMKNYAKAEEYFRRTILKGTNMDLNCAIRNQTYSEMADLYNLMGKPDLADICTSRIESEMRLSGERDLNTQLDVLWDVYKAYDNQGKIEESLNTLRKALRVIEENDGKNNEDYLQYSNLLGLLLKNNNQPQEASSIHKEMIEIGKHFKTYREDVCNAYEYYLQYLSEKGDVDSVELLLPSAVKYITSTKRKGKTENLYESIGIGFFDANKYEEGVKYLEMKWDGRSANSIKALTCLGIYYYYRKNNPEKAIKYYVNAETQIEDGLETSLGTKVSILEYLVLISQRLGHTQEALRYYKMLDPLLKQKDDNDYYSRFIIDWCVECVNSSNIGKAQELAERSESFLDKITDASKIGLLSQLGFVYIKTGEYDKSIDRINKGIKLAIKENGEKAPILETLYHNLGRSYMLQGDYSTALSALNKSKKLQIELEGKVSQRTADYIKECESK